MLSLSRLGQRVVSQPARLFSTCSVRYSILDYFKFYKKKKPELPKQRPTEQVMKDVEGNQDIKGAREIEVLGQRDPRQFDKKLITKNLNGFVVNRWIPKQSLYSKNVKDKEYTSVINEMLQKIYAENFKDPKVGIEDVELDDLAKRFEIIKSVQKAFGLEIPDPQLTLLDNFGKIQAYLVKQLDPKRTLYDELVPDKVNFKESEFEGSNISVGEYVFDAQKSKKLHKLLHKANKMEEDAIKQREKSSGSITSA